MGIANAIIFPNKVPWLNESPNITTKPTKAKTMEIKPFKFIFSLRNKKPKTAKKIVCVLIIKTTLATEVLDIATM